MRRALRFIVAFLKWVAILGTGALLLVIVINLRDEVPTAEARTLSEFRRPTLPDAQNAYLALLGFDAPTGTDPVARGARIVAEHDAIAAVSPWIYKPPEGNPAADGARNNGDALKFAGNDKVLCDPFGRDCLEYARTHTAGIDAVRTANATLVDRYLAIQKMEGFAVTALPSIMQPMPLGNWGSVRRLLMTQAALDAQTDHAPAAITFIGDDIRFWRRVLDGNGNLISSMIAVSSLSTNLHILSALIATPAFPVAEHASALRAILEPLQPRERNLARGLKSEFEMQAAIHRHIFDMPAGADPPIDESFGDKVERWLWSEPSASHFYKPEATINLSAQSFALLIALAGGPPVEFAAGRDQLREHFAAHEIPRLDMVYNPTGKTLVGIAVVPYEEYIARVFDLAAYVQMVRAQLESRLAHVAPDDVPAFLATAGANTSNPYTGQPFEWSASMATLSFEPQSKRWREWSTKVSLALAVPSK